MNIHFATDNTGVKVMVNVNGADYSYINILDTGGWSTYTGDSYLTIPLGPGPTNVILFTGGFGGVNPDYVAFTPLPLPPWNAQIQFDSNFGFKSNQFGFDIDGADWTYVVDALTNLNHPAWTSLVTNTISNGGIVNGTSYFSDAQSTNYPARFYRVRSP